MFFALSLVGLSLIPKSFTPDADFSSPQLKIELPPGVRIEDTAALSAQAAEIVQREPEVLHVIENIGVDDFGEVRSATLYVTLVEPEERAESQTEWEQRVLPKLKGIPDARVYFLSQGAPGLGRDITLFVTGENPPDVERAAYQLVEEMRRLPELADPGVNGDLRRPEIQIRPRLDLAADLGVTVADISQTIRIATIGDIPQNNAKFSVADRQIPIRVSLPEGSRRALETIENLPVPTAAGAAVPLQAVADITFGTGPSRVRRYNQVRRLAVEADLNGVELGPALQMIYALPTAQNLPPGVRLVEVGSAEVMNELFSNFGLAIGAGVLMVFAVLVLLFARVFQPITILSALPLSVGGAVAALALTGFPFSLPTVIGILMLMGIVGKNSILLVDFAIEEMRAGKDRLHALVEAGHKRARPIVMTTIAMIAMIAGMLPVATGIVGDTEFRAPMAVAVIGGLITSTALTLVMVPALFTLIDDLERWLAPRASRFVTGEAGGGALAAGSPQDPV
jgi:multidrug efflux pump subunit AcrB